LNVLLCAKVESNQPIPGGEDRSVQVVSSSLPAKIIETGFLA